MECILLQDWTCIRGNSAPTPVLSLTQSDRGWYDMEPYQDVVAWVGVREFMNPTGGATNVFLDIQTSPVREDNYFLSMIGGFGVALATNGSGPPTVLNLGRDFASVPVSRWLRWKLSTGGTTPTNQWDATFCVWIAANFRSGGGVSISRGGAPQARGQPSWPGGMMPMGPRQRPNGR